MKFGVVVKQQGEGCDYTIGCGINFYQIEAESMDEAVKKLMKLPTPEYDDDEEECIFEDADEGSLAETFDTDDDGERTLEDCIVFPMDSAKNITKAFEDAVGERAALAAKIVEEHEEKSKEEEEKSEYERLREKFGKKK